MFQKRSPHIKGALCNNKKHPTGSSRSALSLRRRCWPVSSLSSAIPCRQAKSRLPRSQAVTTLVNGFLGKFGLGPLSEHIIRKLAHFSEFMLEGFLLMLCLRVYTRHFVRHISWPLLAGMSTALMDETIQISIPNRTSSVTDVWIDMAGAIAGLFVALIILLILRATMAFYQVKRENKALRAEQEALRQREHERLARRAAHRAAQGEDNNEEEDEA